MPRDRNDNTAPHGTRQVSSRERKRGKALVAVLLAVLIAAVVGGVATVAVLLVRAEERRKVQEQQRQDEVRRAEERRSDEIRIKQLDDEYNTLQATMSKLFKHEINENVGGRVQRESKEGRLMFLDRTNQIIAERNVLLRKRPELHRGEQQPFPVESRYLLACAWKPSSFVLFVSILTISSIILRSRGSNARDTSSSVLSSSSLSTFTSTRSPLAT